MEKSILMRAPASHARRSSNSGGIGRALRLRVSRLRLRARQRPMQRQENLHEHLATPLSCNQAGTPMWSFGSQKDRSKSWWRLFTREPTSPRYRDPSETISLVAGSVYRLVGASIHPQGSARRTGCRDPRNWRRTFERSGTHRTHVRCPRCPRFCPRVPLISRDLRGSHRSSARQPVRG